MKIVAQKFKYRTAVFKVIEVASFAGTMETIYWCKLIKGTYRPSSIHDNFEIGSEELFAESTIKRALKRSKK